MKIKIYKYLFRLVSYLTDRTNGMPLFVKYKIALGTILIGITSTSCNSKTSQTRIIIDETDTISILTDSIDVDTLDSPLFVAPIIEIGIIDSDAYDPEPIYCYVPAEPQLEIVYPRKDIFPIPPNGNLKAFRDWVVDNIEYPEQMLPNRIEGKVNVSFVIDEQGDIQNVTIEKSLCKEADKEIERILSTSPRWIPGEMKDSLIKALVKLEIPFEIK